MNKYIGIDVETGGPDSTKYSLLTAYFEVFDHEFNTLGSLYLKIKEDPYLVSAEGLYINKINLIEHDKVAEFKSTAGQKLYKFLSEHFQITNTRGTTQELATTKLIPVGHGISFDLKAIGNRLMGRETFHQFVSYRTLDTGVITQFLKLKGSIPEKVSGSVGSLQEFYGIPDIGLLHSADIDTKITIEILKKQLAN